MKKQNKPFTSILCLLLLILPQLAWAQAKPEAALSPVSAMGDISTIDEQIIYKALEAQLSEKYQLVSRADFEEAQDRMFMELEEKKDCTEEHCIRKIQEILQVERLFTVMILKSGDTTQLSLTLAKNDGKIVREASCDKCKISRLKSEITTIIAQVISEDLGASGTIRRVTPRTGTSGGSGGIRFNQPQVSGNSAVGFAAISLESDPPNAMVLLNDVESGPTPFYDDTLAPNQQIAITLRKEDYHNEQLQLQLNSGINDLGTIKLKPAFGSLKVTSDPTGAEVFLAGRKVGTTPYTDNKLSSKAYMLDLKLEMYLPEKQRIEIEDEQQTVKHIKLTPNFGTLSVDIKPEGSDILLTDKKGKQAAKEQSPAQIRLEPGAYTFSLEKPGYRTVSGTLTLVRGETQRITAKQVTLARKEGRVVISTIPFRKGAEIYLNDKKQPQTVPTTLTLPEGRYKIAVRDDTYSGEQQITVHDAQTQRIKVKLNKSAGWVKRSVSTTKAPSDEVIIDPSTQLMWQKEEPGKMRWQKAINYCKNLNLSGYNDWRLPGRGELESAYQIKKQFPDLHSSYYWSSTTYAGLTSYAWGVDFSYGNVGYGGKGDNGYVRCVRGGR